MNVLTELTQFAENQIEIQYLDGKLKISAPEGAIGELEKQKLKQYKSDIENYCRQMGIQSNFYFAELSFAQQRLWLTEQIEEQKGQYNISQIVNIKGRIDLTALEFAVRQTIVRHDILRSLYKIDVDGTVLQIRTHLAEQILQVEEGLKVVGGSEDLYLRAKQLARTPFDLSIEIPIRVFLYSADADNHLMVFTMHHIASDGTSNSILLQDINQYYNRYLQGNCQPLPPLAIQYMDYARWQRSHLTEQDLTNQMEYWKQKLQGAPQVHELPTDRTRPRVPSHRGRVYVGQISSLVLNKMKQIASQEQASLFMLLGGVFALLKSRFSGINDIVFGTPFANRERIELQQMVGLFVNSLVLRYQLHDSFTFYDLIVLSKTTLLEAYEHQDIPFDLLVESLKPERNMSVTPFFQSLFSFHSHEGVSVDFSGLEISQVHQQDVAAQFDLVLDAVEENHQLTLSWVYAEDLFDEVSVVVMHNAFAALCAGLVEYPKANVFSIPLVSETEQARLLSAPECFKNTISSANTCDELWQMAQKKPNNTALQYDDGELTYLQLLETVSKLATLIRRYDLPPESRIGIYMGRSQHVVIAVLAVMFSGNAFVPLDPDYPESRVAYIISDAQIELVLTLKELQAEVLDHCDNVLALDSDLLSKIMAGVTADREKPCIAPDSLAYILYTSGTSGLPKGVAVEHQQMSNYVKFAQGEYINVHGIKGSVLSSALSFDATITAMLPGLVAGVPLLIIDQEAELLKKLLELLDSATPYLFKLTPAHLLALTNMASAESTVATRHLLVVGGEQLENKVCEVIKKRFKGVIIINEYGPTETVVGCCIKYVDDTFDGKVPIGNPCAGSTILLMSEYQQIQPKGAVGEIYIAGPGVSRGYHNNLELTDEKFVWLDVGEGQRKRFYRTGDLAKRLTNDELVFLGRNDQQIKVRGFRIEPEEISRVATCHEHVEACQVLLDKEQQSLVAYLLPHLTNEQLYSLREHFKRSLPDYMQPDLLIPVHEFPYTINGKLDMEKLKNIDISEAITSNFAEPESPLQEQLCELWCDLLHLPKVSIDDSFFELGGHSLLATQLVAQLRQQHDAFIEIRDIFKHNSIRELSLLLEQETNIHSYSATELTGEDEVWEI